MSKLLNSDMHIHTTASDGEYSAVEIYRKIKETNQITTFAITDHDNINGVKALEEYLTNNPDPEITFIRGIEMSGSISNEKYKVDRYQLHILGYDFDLNNPSITQITETRRQIDQTNIKRQLEELKKLYGITFKTKEIETILAKPKINRVDIAKLLYKHGYAKNIKDAFNKYLTETNERVRHTLPKIYEQDIIPAIKDANGYVSLAHPTSLRQDLETLKDYIKYLKSLGLDSIEVYHSHHKRAYSNKLYKIAEEQELYISGGSDYHGPTVKPKVHLGIDKGRCRQKTLTLKDHIISQKK